jgi:uncharacterized protein YqeY
MSIRARLSDDLKTAMRAKDEKVVHTARLVLAAIKDKDIAARPGGNTSGIDDAGILQLMNNMIKQRKDSIALYHQGNRPELAQKEQDEIDIIQRYMPQQMGEAEVVAAVKAAIAATGAGSVKDMGKVMAALKEKHAGQMDFAAVSGVVKQQLAS